MKRIIIYAMIGAVTFAAAGGGTMFYLNQVDKDKANQNNTEVPEEILPEPEPPTNQELFLTNILNGNLNVQNLDVVVYDLEPNENLAINFKGAFDYKGLELAKGNFSEFKIQGDLSAKYKDIDEKLNLTFLPGTFEKDSDKNGLTNGKIYFTYADQNFSFDANTVVDVLNTLKIFDIPVDNVKQELDLGDSMNDAMGLLNEIQETETENGFDYTLAIPDMGTVVLESTKGNRLSGVRTEGQLNLGGTKISVDADIVCGDDSFVTTPNDGQRLNSIAGIFETVAKIYDQKAVNTSFNIKFRNDADKNKIDLDLNGNLAVDVNGFTMPIAELTESNLKEGKYALTLNPVGSLNGNPQVNEIKALYSNRDIYLQVNNLLKGKLTDQTIMDLVELVSTKAEAPQLDRALNKITNFLEGSDIVALTKGDFNAIKRIVKQVNITDTKYEFIFDSKSFNLPEGEIKLAIGLDENSNVKTISLNGLHFETYFLDFTLNLEEYKGLEDYFDDYSSFKDYSGALDIYNSVAGLVNTKKVHANYSIDLLNENPEQNLSLIGNLQADLNGVDFKDSATLKNGKYALDIATEIGGHPRFLNADYQNETTYVNYNDLVTNKISNSTLVDTFTIIDNMMTKTDADGNETKPSDAFAGLNSVLGNIKTKYQPLIDDVLKGNLVSLESYIKIDENNLNKDLLDLQISPNGDSNYTINIQLNNVENKLNSLSVSGVEFNGYTLNAKLDLIPYQDRVIDEILFAPIDNLLYGVLNLIQNPKLSASLNASILDTTKTVDNEVKLAAKANIDVTTGSYYGDLDVTAKLPVDKYPYHHRISFDYYKTEDGLDSELLAKYRSVNDNDGVETSPMYINMHETKIISLVNRIKDVPAENVIYKLLQRTKEVHQLLPIEEIINGNYELIFNEYLKNFHIEPLVNEVTNEHVLNILVDGSLVGLDGDLNVDVVLNANTNKITHLTIKDLTMGATVINIEASLEDYDESLDATRLKVTDPKESKTYFDFDNLDLLFEVGINTTMASTYHLKGNFELTVPGGLDTLAIKIGDICYNIDIRINILDTGKVEGFIDLRQAKNTNFVQNVHTEIAILSNDDAIIHQTREINTFTAITPKWQKHHEIFKLSNEEMNKNFLYYFVYYILRFPSIIFNPIQDAVSKPSTGETNPIFNIQYESIFQTMDHRVTSDDGRSGEFSSTINLNKIVDIGAVTSGFVQAYSANITVGYNEDEVSHLKTLSFLRIKSDKILYISVIGIELAIGLNFSVSNMLRGTTIQDMKQYNDLLIYYEANAANKEYAYYDTENKILNNCNTGLPN